MAHTPVLLHEAITLLELKSGAFVIDGTVGSGGHAEEILKRIGKRGTLLGVDWDEGMLALCREKLGEREGVTLAHGNYATLPEILRKKKLPKADGLLLDLGFSSEQLARSGRGFSFQSPGYGEPLRMTYDARRPPLSTLLQQMTEEELRRVISEYGEERYAKKIARAIGEGTSEVQRMLIARGLGLPVE